MTNNVFSCSFVANGSKSCSGGCSYCSASSSMHYTMNKSSLDSLRKDLEYIDEKSYSEFKADFNKVEETLDNDVMMNKALEASKQNGNPVLFKADLWCADPVTSISVLQEMVDFLEDYCKRRNFICQLHTSTNGLPLIDNKRIDYLHEHSIKIQLSHDGCGQWIRTGEALDPMDFDNTKQCIKDGTLNWINCTLSKWNYSFFDNIKYWNKRLEEIFPGVISKNANYPIFNSLYLKLNHIYDGDYDIKSINKEGRINSYVDERCKGMPLGNLALKNYEQEPFRHVLDDYMYELKTLALQMMDPTRKNSNYLRPYRGYITEQIRKTGRIVDPEKDVYGACRSFQMGLVDRTFVIDTTGRYSQCNLIDADSKVLNPTARRPEYCKTCKYYHYEDCAHCGSVDFPKECEFQYRMCQLLDELKWTSGVLSKINETAVADYLRSQLYAISNAHTQQQKKCCK